MNMNLLEKIDDYTWTIPLKAGEKRSGILLYGSEPLLKSMDNKVLEQISNVATLPGLVGQAMTMPDAHWGYGFPIGGVAAFDAEEGGIISAGGVGFDISCGIRCLRTDLMREDLTSTDLTKLADELYRTIPAGVGKEGKLKLTIDELDDVLKGGAQWAIHHGYGVGEDLSFVEEMGKMKGARPENISQLAKERQLGEVGTLGSGNHYLEVQEVAKIYDEKAAEAFGIKKGQIVVSIHCGSRALGHQIGTEYMVSLAKAAMRLGILLPDRELACAPIHSPEGQEYIGAMNAAINCAMANRQVLTHMTRNVFEELFKGVKIETLYDVSHNTCKEEIHLVNGVERTLWVHRKGATRAFGPGHPNIPARYRSVGQPVIIGGSMGTGSYILAGSTEGEERAFSSASHGAGRAMSRHQALKLWRGKQVIQELAQKGIMIRSASMRGIAEEAPDAYKDVDLVAEATEKAGLARRVAFLKPKVCIKG
ncbi:RtcB family protein [Campylobacterota bacterium]